MPSPASRFRCPPPPPPGAVAGTSWPSWLVLAAVLAATAAVLDLMGHAWWCGGPHPWTPWSGEVWSRHNSQHLLDPYAATHVLHGILFYGALWWAVGARWSAPARAWAALGIEVAWEIVENTPLVIDRYRETTLALGYYGDSIINSLADIVSFVAGYALARVLPVWALAAVVVLVEGVLVVTIRDSLTLNVVMLLFPMEALKEWQMAGAP